MRLAALLVTIGVVSTAHADSISRSEACLAAARGDVARVTSFLAERRGNLDTDDTYDGTVIDGRTDNDGTLLHCAARGDHAAVATLLLDHHATIDALDRDGYTPLHRAAELGNVALVSLLGARHANLELADGQGRTPLHTAAGLGQTKVVRALIALGATVDAAAKGDSYGTGLGATPLTLAIAEKHDETAKVLLDLGASPDAMAATGPQNAKESLLEQAAGQGSVGIVRLLLAHHVKLDGDVGTAALLAAAHGNHLEIVSLLLDHKVAIDACSIDHDSLLSIAADGDNIALAKLALARKPDASCVDQLLVSTISNGADHMFDLILARMHAPLGADGEYALRWASARGSVHDVTALLARKVAADAPDAINASALHFAVHANAIAIVKLLLARGADVNRMTSASASAEAFVTQPVHVSTGGPPFHATRCNIRPLDLASSPEVKQLLEHAGATAGGPRECIGRTP